MGFIDKLDLQAYGLDSHSEQLIKQYLTAQNVLIVVAIYVGLQRVRWLANHLWVRSQVKGLHSIHSAVEVFEAGHRSKLPHIPGLIPANDFTIKEPWRKYQKAQSDLIACTQWTTDYPVYITSNPHVAASVAAKTTIFHKPLSMFRYVAINCFGDQIVSMQTGAPHSRHKGVIKGCFGENIMQGAWTKMEEAFETMVAECKVDKGGVLPNIEETLVILTLIVIGEMGFGVQFPWTIEKTDSAMLPLPEALYVVEHSMEAQLILPLWLMKYNPFASVRRLARAQESLIYHIKSLIDRRGKEITVETAGLPKGEKIRPPSDLLGAMVASNMESDNGQGLSAKELMGNVWIMIVAGHETSAHVLGFTLGYLALHPEEQDKILAELDEVCGGAAPSYRDMPKLKYTLAALYESIRLRDIVMTLPKLVVSETTIPYTTWDASGIITNHTRPLPAGAHLIIDSPACSMNPFTWTDPTVFRPERFLDEGVKNHFTGFSSGSRMCIGKRFAEVEMVCFLANFVRTFKFAPIPKQGESREDVYRRYTEGNEVLNLTPGKWDLNLERRV